MTISLTWVRDHYDANRSKHIDTGEMQQAVNDAAAGTITQAQRDAVVNAWQNNTLLPMYGTAKEAKGTIVNFDYPATAKTNERVAIRSAVRNTGNTSGTFKVQLIDIAKIRHDGYTVTPEGYLRKANGDLIAVTAYKLAQTSSFSVAAGATSPIKTMYVTTASSGGGTEYQLWCTRIT